MWPKNSGFLECFSSLHFNRRYFLSQIYVMFVLPEVLLSDFEVISAREKKIKFQHYVHGILELHTTYFAGIWLTFKGY